MVKVFSKLSHCYDYEISNSVYLIGLFSSIVNCSQQIEFFWDLVTAHLMVQFLSSNLKHVKHKCCHLSLLSLKFVSAVWLRQGSGVQTRWCARAVQRARRAPTGLSPSLSTAFSVSFYSTSDCTAGDHKHGENGWFHLNVVWTSMLCRVSCGGVACSLWICVISFILLCRHPFESFTAALC